MESHNGQYMTPAGVETAMRTRRQVLGTVVAMTTTTLAGCSTEAGEESSGPGLFAPGFTAQTIPERYTCAGGDISPELEFSDVSQETESFALIMDDPDTPSQKPFVHWLIWNIPPNTAALPEGIPTQPRVDLSERETDPGFTVNGTTGSILQGTNDAGEIGYRGPCPPPEDPPHTYEFTLYAVRSTIDVPPGAKRPALESAIQDTLIGKTTITGTFDRK